VSTERGAVCGEQENQQWRDRIVSKTVDAVCLAPHENSRPLMTTPYMDTRRFFRAVCIHLLQSHAIQVHTMISNSQHTQEKRRKSPQRQGHHSHKRNQTSCVYEPNTYICTSIVRGKGWLYFRAPHELSRLPNALFYLLVCLFLLKRAHQDPYATV
jgi:hypothetical protein